MPAGERPAAELLSALSQLMRTSRSVAQRQTQNLVPSGTPLGVLKALSDGDARPGDLATRLCVAPSVVSRAVVPLEASGLVERRHDPADARAWRLRLTRARPPRGGARPARRGRRAARRGAARLRPALQPAPRAVGRARRHRGRAADDAA